MSSVRTRPVVEPVDAAFEPRILTHSSNPHRQHERAARDHEPDPLDVEPWDPDTWEDDEPEPQPGDFWPQFDDE